VTHQYLDLMEQLPKGIYDIRDLEVARGDLVKHRCEQEKVIAANEANLHCVLSRQQFLKMNGGINPAETTAQNDDSFFAQPSSDASDHRVLSGSGAAGAAVEKPVDAARTIAQTVARSSRPVVWTALRRWGWTHLTPSQSRLSLR